MITMSEQLMFLFENSLHLLIGFPGYRPGGLLLSLLLAGVSIGFGFGIALFVGIGAVSVKRPLRTLSSLYVQLFRGIPLILLLLIVHQFLGNGRYLGFKMTPLLSALVALTLYSSAYQAEIVRSGLKSVPTPLTDSAQLLGSKPAQVFRLIKLRYTWHVMLPAFTGQAISLFKDSSVVVILGVAELMTVARIVLGSDIGNTPYWVELYLMVGFLYFIVAFSLSRIAQRWERQHQIGDLVHSMSNY